jgi:PAS domain S-box-containing protein
MEKAEPIHVQPNSGTTMGPDTACSFSGCIMPAMASSGQGSERLNAQLLVDSIPALIHTARPDGYLDYFNKPWLEYLGVTLDKVTGWNWTAVVHPEDVEGIVAKWRACLATGEVFEYETRVRSANGEYRWMFHRKVPLRDANGNIVKWYGSSLDIEERKTAEEKLRRSERDLHSIIETIPTMVWSAAPDGSVDFFNPRWLDYTGLSPDQSRDWRWTAPIHPDDLSRLTDAWQSILVTGELGETEARLRRFDGAYRWFLFRVNPLRDESGKIVKWYGTNVDIEDRKRAEEELRRSEFYLSEGQRLAHMGSWVLDPAGCFPYWSHELFHIYGLDPAKEGPSSEEYLASIHPQDREFMRSLINRMIAEASGCDVTKRIVRPSGEVRHVRCVGVPIVENGRLKRIVGTAIDVTEHEFLTQELRRREAYLTEAQRLSHTGSFGWRPDSGEIVWSDETYRIFEYDRLVKPTIDSVTQRVHPQDRADFQRVIDGASRGATDFEHTYRLLLPDGRVKDVHAIAHALQDASGDREFVGAATDITERKTAEEALRSSEAYLAEAQRLSQTGSWAWSPDEDIRYWSEECYRVLSFDSRDGLPRFEDFFQRIHPDDQPGFRELIETAIREKAEWQADYRIVHPDGPVRDIHVVGHPVLSTSGHLVEFVGTVIDVTERKQAEEERKRAEEALRNSEAYLAEAQRLSHTGSWAWNPGTDVRYWSEECYRVLGFDPRDGAPRMEELIQRIHPDDQPAFRESTKRAKHKKFDEEVDYRVVHPGGAVRDIHSIGHPVFSPCGDLIEYTGTVIDVTERKRAEEELRRSEMELRQMLDFTPLYLGVHGPDGSPLYANRASLDYLGMSLDEWRQRPMDTNVHPDDVERLNRASSSGSASELELRVRNRDGKFRWILARFNPLRDEKGQITRWYTASTDIDDRKRAEEKLQQENVALREEIDKASMFEEIVGTSPALKSVLSRISKVAPSDSTVLITGETGTGKELVARAIHRRSDRASRAFVSVNCAAIPRDLIASELFGHEKGAFTGATQQRLGRFELANGGTIFLDEVGELPIETQIALLRVLQEHEFERVGGSRRIRADVRVIAATNRDLQAAISAGTFRSDLFYRLHVFPIEMPSLRERKEDIPLLVEYFIDRYARKAGKNIKRVNKKTLELLQSYPWPGNIRELQNVIERSVILCETENFSIDENWLPQPPPLTPESKQEVELPRRLLVQEKDMIEEALKASRGRVFGPTGAAAKLGIPRSTLESKIKSLKIDKNRFRAVSEI